MAGKIAKVDYSSISLTEREPFIDTVKNFYEQVLVLSEGQLPQRINYVIGEHKDNQAKIFCNTETITIEHPVNEVDSKKLAALLYALSKVRKVHSEIIYKDPAGDDITTKHMNWAGDTQKKIEAWLAGAEPLQLEIDQKQKPYAIHSVKLDEEQYKEFERLPKQHGHVCSGPACSSISRH